MISGTKSLSKVLTLAATAALAVFALAADGSSEDLSLASHADLGEIVVDASGNTVYMFQPDEQSESTCYDACAEAWPPVAADGEVTVGEGLSQDLVGAVSRSDGSEQLTYGGWPLYTFAQDTEAGQANGQGLNGVWYVLDAAGTPVGMPETSGDGSQSGDAEDSAGSGKEEDAADQGEDSDDGAAGGSDMAALMQEGAEVYRRICAACHGANGNEALAEHVAILANNSRLENENRVVRRIIHGGGYMPPFGGVLSDREVAAVATFIRNSWGNEFGPVGEEAAAEMR